MNLNDRLLKIKELTPLQKLISGLILDTHPAVMNMLGGYNNTCGDIAKELGTTRTKVLKAIDSMQKMGYIKSDVKPGRRISNLTEKLIQLLFPLNESPYTAPIDKLMIEEEGEEDLSFLD